MNHPDGHLLNWHSVSHEAWDWCLHRALEYGDGNIPTYGTAGSGRQIGLVFFNDSLRTRASMEVAAHQLGAYPLLVTPGSGTWGFAWERGVRMDGQEAEHIREAVGVLARYVDLIGVRLFASGTDLDADRRELKFRAMIEASAVPLINLESAFWHPCQALADAAVLTRATRQSRGRQKFVLSWAPHPKPLPTAVPNSTLLMAARLGLDVVLARPKGFDLDESVMRQADVEAAEAGGRISVTSDRAEAFEGADFVYAKSWGGLGRYDSPDEEAALRASLGDWRLTEHDMKRTHHAGFMHCLPVRRGVVVEDAVIDAPSSLHLEQAAYRLHAQKAILEWFWGSGAREMGLT
jgi:N-acetylornithine carbamoyltransferase